MKKQKQEVELNLNFEPSIVGKVTEDKNNIKVSFKLSDIRKQFKEIEKQLIHNKIIKIKGRIK